MRILAGLILLVSICADVAAVHCDLPRGGGSRIAVAATVGHGGDADPCASACVPDCYTCSRSELAAVSPFAFRPQVVAAVVPTADARASDGVLAPPYHPPLHLR